MKTYETSKNYELLADLLESGAVIVRRFGGKPWTQFQATKQGKYTSFRGHGRASFISLCQMQNWEFIVPTVEVPEPVTREQQIEMMIPGEWVKHLATGRIGRITGHQCGTSIENKRIDVRWTDGSISNAMPAEAFGAMRLKWWTFSTAPVQLKVIRRDGAETILYFEMDDDLGWCFYDSRHKVRINAREVAEEYVQLNGMPCGELEDVK